MAFTNATMFADATKNFKTKSVNTESYLSKPLTGARYISIVSFVFCRLGCVCAFVLGVSSLGFTVWVLAPRISISWMFNGYNYIES